MISHGKTLFIRITFIKDHINKKLMKDAENVRFGNLFLCHTVARVDIQLQRTSMTMHGARETAMAAASSCIKLGNSHAGTQKASLSLSLPLHRHLREFNRGWRLLRPWYGSGNSKPLIPSWSTCLTLTSNNQERATTKKTARHIKTNQKTESSKQVKNHQTTYRTKQQKHRKNTPNIQPKEKKNKQHSKKTSNPSKYLATKPSKHISIQANIMKKRTRKYQNHKKQNQKEYANIKKSARNMENAANNPAKKSMTPLTHIWYIYIYINKTA